MSNCQRCGKETYATMMSMMNTQECCMECIEDEKKSSSYEDARAEESRQVKLGNFNFKGLFG